MVRKEDGRVVIGRSISSRWRGVYSHVEVRAHANRDIGKFIKGVISLSILSHSLGIKGVITVSRSEDKVTLLGGMGGGATQGA